MTRLRVASLNMSGVERAGVWARFLKRCMELVEKDGVDVVLGQEHNLHPSREGELMRWAEVKGFALVIAFAPRGEDNVHRGGTLMLTPSRRRETVRALVGTVHAPSGRREGQRDRTDPFLGSPGPPE